MIQLAAPSATTDLKSLAHHNHVNFEPHRKHSGI